VGNGQAGAGWGEGKAELALFWTDCCGALARRILNRSP
jgi:hypothetical protein